MWNSVHKPEQVDWTPLAGATKPCDKHPSYDWHPRCICEGKPVYFFPASVRGACRGDVDCECCDTDEGCLDSPCEDGMVKWPWQKRRHKCRNCQGLGWVAETDGWVWWRIIRQVGWFVCLFQYFDWDEFVIQDTHGDPIASTTSEDNLQDEAALHVVFCRAVEADGGTLGVSTCHGS